MFVCFFIVFILFFCLFVSLLYLFVCLYFFLCFAFADSRRCLWCGRSLMVTDEPPQPQEAGENILSNI